MGEKVLFISYDGMTDPLGQSQVLPYLVGLSQKGYQVTLVSFEKKDRFAKSRDIIENITRTAGIDWQPLFFSSRPPVLSKLYDLFQLRRKVFKLHRKKKFDFTHCRSYVAAGAGLALKRKFGVKFLFDMRGFWVDERVDGGQWDLSKPFYRFLYKRYKRIEKSYFNEAAHIISLTNKGKQELHTNYNVQLTHVTVIPCCVDLEHFDFQKINSDQKMALMSKLNLRTDSKVLTYLGSLGGWYLGIEMMNFFKVLKDKVPKAKFLFITHDNREQILKIAIAAGVRESDIIVWAASRAEVPLYLSLSDWSIFFIKDAYSKKASSPTKQGEIMAMGIPIICNDIGDTGFIVKESGTGIIIKGFSVSDFTNVADGIDALQQVNKNFIRNAAFRYFDLNSGIEKYLQVYDQMKTL